LDESETRIWVVVYAPLLQVAFTLPLDMGHGGYLCL
jgi:hypothetical protein